MHNNFYFLRQLCPALLGKIHGTVISECFSQAKDELIIRFETHTKSFYIKAALGAGFAGLSFPEDFQRARKNSIDLFPEIIGHRITAIRQYENERSFALILEEGKTLLFKMHGNRSNLILFEQNTPVTFFRNNLPADAALDLATLDRTLAWSFDAFVREKNNLERHYFTFGKLVWRYLIEHNFLTLSNEEQFQLITEVRRHLEQPRYYFTLWKGQWHLSLLPFPGSEEISKGPLETANQFYYRYTHDAVFQQERSKLIALIQGKIQSSERYIQKNFQKLTEIESDNSYKMWADLVMANLHSIKPGTGQVELDDFYHPGKKVQIRLKTDLNAQSNAAIFYKKSKNQHIEIERLETSIAIKEKDIEKMKRELQEISSISDLKILRKKTEHYGMIKEREAKIESLPYYEFLHQGFRIWVGKSAKDNDELTQKYAYKEDLWLHAKDVPGSHVIIKHQSGKNFPKDVIERAAELAAFNSKRKTEALCPVVVTPKKFVRKRKGDVPGAVVVDREDVILVEPKL